MGRPALPRQGRDVVARALPPGADHDEVAAVLEPKLDTVPAPEPTRDHLGLSSLHRVVALKPSTRAILNPRRA